MFNGWISCLLNEKAHKQSVPKFTVADLKKDSPPPEKEYYDADIIVVDAADSLIIDERKVRRGAGCRWNDDEHIPDVNPSTLLPMSGGVDSKGNGYGMGD